MLKKLSLHRETIQQLTSNQVDDLAAAGITIIVKIEIVETGSAATSWNSLAITAGLSAAYCGSNNGCASLDTCKWSGITTQPC